MKLYKTRKQQIEKEILNDLVDDLRAGSCGVSPELYGILRDYMMRVAMIGAAEERQHCLGIVREWHTSVTVQIDSKITEQSVFAVLGYPEANKQLAAPLAERASR